MATDLLLKENEVTVQASVTKIEGYDLQIDCPGRRLAENTKPSRRALVHDIGDLLIINCDNDYVKGTRIMSDVGITGALHVDKSIVSPWQCYFEDVKTNHAEVKTLDAESAHIKGQLNVDKSIVSPWQCYFEQVTTKDLIVKGNTSVQGQLSVTGKVALDGIADLANEISILRAKIKELQEEVAHLKNTKVIL